MNRQQLTNMAQQKGLSVSYSGNTKTLFVKGDGSDEFKKRWSPDSTGHIRNSKGHFIKGGLGFQVK